MRHVFFAAAALALSCSISHEQVTAGHWLFQKRAASGNGFETKTVAPANDKYFGTDESGNLVLKEGGGASGSLVSSSYTMSTGTFLGRTTSGTGAIEELALGTGVAPAIGTPLNTSGGLISFDEDLADLADGMLSGNKVGNGIAAGSA
jgi:hypothetical protein